MALWTIGTPTKVRPPEVEPRKPKRTRGVLKRIAWVTAALVSVAAITILVWNIATQGLFTGEAIPRTVPPTVTVTTTPSTIPPTTEPVVVLPSVTTATTPSTTTTAPPTTTTTVPESDYIWDGEADFRWFGRLAQLGVLRDEWRDDGPNSGDMIIRDTILSGVFQGAYQKEITIAGDTVNAWFITMYMGDHPTTGRAMVVDFYIGDHPDTVIQRGDLSSDTIPEDSYNESSAEIYNTEPEVILKDLEVGRQYLFMMFAGAGEFPDDIDAHKVEVLESLFLKGKEVVDFLNGEREDPLPADAFGWAYRVYFPNSL